MSITKTYGFSSYPLPEHVMPVDLAMYAQISPPTPRSSTELLRLSPPSPTSSLSSSSSGSSLSSYSPGNGTLRKKKQVVFADAKGLTLEFIYYFTVDPLEMDTENKAQREERAKPRVSMQNMRPRVKLGFPQPVPDRARLKETFVQLESCSVNEKELYGTVRVYNIMYDKTVYVRITFDSWRSYTNIPCSNLREPYGALESDLFVFNKVLPSDLDPNELMEFFVVLQSGISKKCVDDNKGKNYQIFVENVVPEPRLMALERRLTPSETRLVSSEHRLSLSEPRLLSGEHRLSPSEPRMVSSEHRLSLSEPRLLSAEHRQSPSEFRRTHSKPRHVALEQRPSTSEFRRSVLEPRQVVQSRRSFITPSPQRSSAWPAIRVLDSQKTKYQTCRGPPYTEHLVNKTLKFTNVPQLC